MMLRYLIYVITVFLAAPVLGQTAEDLRVKAYIESIAANPTQEQLDRKARSIRHLTDLGVPVLDNLPVITDAARATRRTSHEVAERALAAMIAAVMGETADHQLIAQFWGDVAFTPEEQAFVALTDPDMPQRAKMSWRYEGVAVLLWSVGIIDDLDPPRDIVDAAMLGSVFASLGRDGLLSRARLRPQSEILDMADLIYRMHWAVGEARVNDTPPPPGLEPGVVFERHRALNWLFGYAGLSWDDMRTDT